MKVASTITTGGYERCYPAVLVWQHMAVRSHGSYVIHELQDERASLDMNQTISFADI